MTYYRYDSHTQNAADRFWSKVEKTSKCWHWQAYRDSDGYGQFTLNFLGQKYVLRAHRVSWLLSNKTDWPVDKPVARHLCNNPSCVRPDHIEPGTVSENTIDSIQAGTFKINRGAARTVITPIGEFRTGQKAAQALGVSHNTLIQWLKKQKPGYCYSPHK